MIYEDADKIIQTVQKFSALGLSVGCSGNASSRSAKGFFITPTGIEYSSLQLSDLVELDISGKILAGEKKPSSEWQFHSAIYAARKDANAIVHVHSPYATALACHRQPIPAFHYMVAKAGGDSIRCAEYATFGSSELANNTVDALTHRKACLLANHGLVAIGEDIQTALSMAVEVEELAKQLTLAKIYGEPILLSDEEMQVNIDKFSNYGKQ